MRRKRQTGLTELGGDFTGVLVFAVGCIAIAIQRDRD